MKRRRRRRRRRKGEQRRAEGRAWLSLDEWIGLAAVWRVVSIG